MYFRRCDTGAWDIIHASHITTEMVTRFPGEEQERIAAHGVWARVWEATTDTDRMGRTTAAARKARHQIKAWGEECAAKHPELTRFQLLDTAAGICIEDGFFPSARAALTHLEKIKAVPAGGWPVVTVQEYESRRRIPAVEVLAS